MRKIIFIALFWPTFLQAQRVFDLSNLPQDVALPSPNVTIEKTSLPEFANNAGTASAYATCNYTYSDLTTSNGGITLPSGFEGSTNGGSSYQTSFTGLSSGSGTLRVRVAASTAAGTYGPVNINFTIGGVTKKTCTVTAVVTAVSDTQRILVDWGGNGVIQGGTATPTNSAGTYGVDSAGKTWLNMLGLHVPRTIISNPKDITGTEVTGFSMAFDKSPAGTFATNDSALNSNVNCLTPIGDYPWSATSDCMYMHSSAGIVTWTIHLPAGKHCSIKVWGTRINTGTRRMDVKKGTDASFTQYFESINNTNYDQAVTLYDLADGDTMQWQVHPGDTYASCSVFDIKVY